MKQQGFILVTALIFLFLLSLIAFQALEGAMLQQKIQQTWMLQQQLFYLAETRLKQGEEQLTSRVFTDGEIRITGPKVFEMKDKAKLFCYRITAIASRDDATVTLQSTYVKFDPPMSQYEGIRAGRQTWLQLNGDE